MNKIITISRQFGSGGRTIGKQVAASLGIPVYDKDIIEKTAEKSGFAREYIAEHGEYKSAGQWVGNILAASNSVGGISNGDLIWVTQRKIILDIAKEESCVIVGRCADYILEGQADLLKVFVYADKKFRAKRIVEEYGESSVAPEKRLKSKDKKRAAYYKYYTEMEWGDVKNYTISLNSGEIGIDKCSEILVDLYKNMH